VVQSGVDLAVSSVDRVEVTRRGRGDRLCPIVRIQEFLGRQSHTLRRVGKPGLWLPWCAQTTTGQPDNARLRHRLCTCDCMATQLKLKPTKPIGRFDVFAEYRRLDAEDEGMPADQTKGYAFGWRKWWPRAS